MKKLHSITTSIALLLITTVATAEDSWFSIPSLSSLFDHNGDNENTKPVTWVSIKTNNYNKIDVGSDVSLMINPNHKHKNNVIIQDPDITAYVQNNTLYLQGKCISKIDCNKTHNAFIKDISNIKHIHTSSNAKVYGENLKKYNSTMQINTEGESSIALNGMINIESVQYNSSEASKILWIDAQDLAITAHNGRLEIAGVANKTTLRADNKAQVGAAQLRTKNSWVSTEDAATVSIGTLNYLYAHSENDSIISYPQDLRETVFITKDNSKIINSKLALSYVATK